MIKLFFLSNCRHSVLDILYFEVLIFWNMYVCMLDVCLLGHFNIMFAKLICQS